MAEQLRHESRILNPLFEAQIKRLTKKFQSKKITVLELKEMISQKQGILIIDTREESEFNVSHIYGATNVGYQKFDINSFFKSVPKGKKIVTYCSVGYRSGVIADQLMRNGYDVYNLWGGIFEWVNQGNDIYSNESRKTKQIHAYDKNWGKWITNQVEKVY